MEEQKPKDSQSETADSSPEVRLMDRQPIAAAIEGTPEPVVTGTTRKKSNLYTYIAAALVVFALGAVWMRLETEGRVNTSFFSGIADRQAASAAIATVNGDTLRARDLELSMEQLRQAAAAQGLNPTDPSVAEEIRSQATEMLVNTTLLRQAAADAGVNISEEEVAARIAELEEGAGGAEALAARMDEYDIDRDTFETDVETELTILALLDTVFAEADLTVSDQEVTDSYERIIETSPDAPALEEIRPQIEQQIIQFKEQQAVDAYLEEIRATADIDIKG